MSKNLYADVIDIITNLSDDQWKPLCVAIAKSKPSAFLSACERVGVTLAGRPKIKYAAEKWFDVIVTELSNERKIHAIKELRTATGLGLYDSKLIVEEIQDKCGDYIESIRIQKNHS